MLFVRKQKKCITSEMYNGVYVLLLQYGYVFKEEKIPR